MAAYKYDGGIAMQEKQTDPGIARRIKWSDIMRIHFPIIGGTDLDTEVRAGSRGIDRGTQRIRDDATMGTID